MTWLRVQSLASLAARAGVDRDSRRLPPPMPRSVAGGDPRTDLKLVTLANRYPLAHPSLLLQTLTGRAGAASGISRSSREFSCWMRLAARHRRQVVSPKTRHTLEMPMGVL